MGAMLLVAIFPQKILFFSSLKGKTIFLLFSLPTITPEFLA